MEEAEAEEEVVPRKTDSKEGDNSHLEVHGNPEEQEEEDKDLTRAQCEEAQGKCKNP